MEDPVVSVELGWALGAYDSLKATVFCAPVWL